MRLRLPRRKPKPERDHKPPRPGDRRIIDGKVYRLMSISYDWHGGELTLNYLTEAEIKKRYWV